MKPYRAQKKGRPVDVTRRRLPPLYLRDIYPDPISRTFFSQLHHARAAGLLAATSPSTRIRRLSPVLVNKVPDRKRWTTGTGAGHHLMLGVSTCDRGHSTGLAHASQPRANGRRHRAAGFAGLVSRRLRRTAAAPAVLSQMREEPDCDDLFPGRSRSHDAVARADLVWCRGMVARLPDDPAAPLFQPEITTRLSASPRSPGMEVAEGMGSVGVGPVSPWRPRARLDLSRGTFHRV